MNFVRLREAAIAPDYIAVARRYDYDQAHSQIVICEFREEMKKLARWMSKTNIQGKKSINRPLMSALINAFENVSYEVFETNEQLANLGRRKENQIFRLRHEDEFASPDIAEKPHKGRIILSRAKNGELYIPHPDSIIPLNLNVNNIDYIGGSVGRNLISAFYVGSRDLCADRTAKPRIQCETDRALLDHIEMNEFMLGQSDMTDEQAPFQSQQNGMISGFKGQGLSQKERHKLEAQAVVRHRKAQTLAQRAERRRLQAEKAEAAKKMKVEAAALAPQVEVSFKEPRRQHKITVSENNLGTIRLKHARKKEKNALKKEQAQMAEAERKLAWKLLKKAVNIRLKKAKKRTDPLAVERKSRHLALAGTREKQGQPAPPSYWWVRRFMATSHSLAA